MKTYQVVVSRASGSGADYRVERQVVGTYASMANAQESIDRWRATIKHATTDARFTVTVRRA